MTVSQKVVTPVKTDPTTGFPIGSGMTEENARVTKMRGVSVPHRGSTLLLEMTKTMVMQSSCVITRHPILLY